MKDTIIPHSWRRKAALLILVITIVSVAVVYGYLNPKLPSTVPSKPGPQASLDAYPLSLTIGLDKSEYATGESITATCTMKNISNETVAVHFSEEMMELNESGPKPQNYRIYFNLVITKEDGSIVYSWESNRGDMPVLISMSLKPGDELGNSFLWNQKTKSPLPIGVQIPAGKYFVKARLCPRGRLWIDNGPWIELETPSITFTIR